MYYVMNSAHLFDKNKEKKVLFKDPKDINKMSDEEKQERLREISVMNGENGSGML